MTLHLSLNRWTLVLLLAVTVLLLGGWGLRMEMNQTAEAPSPSPGMPVGIETDQTGTEASGAASSRRSRGERSSVAAQEARLRSLLDLKKGEMAWLELSPEAMQEVFHIEGAVQRMEDGFGFPARVELSAEARGKLAGMVRRGMPVTGKIDTSTVLATEVGQCPFSWQGADWKASGYSLNNTSEQTLQLHLEGQGKEMLTCITVPDGGAFLFVLPGSNRGLMIVAGGKSPEPPPGP